MGRLVDENKEGRLFPDDDDLKRRAIPRKQHRIPIIDNLKPIDLRRLRRHLGKKCKLVTRFVIAFDLFTPEHYPYQPWEDAVMLLDVLDAMQLHIMDFHDIPGFRLHSVKILNRYVVPPLTKRRKRCALPSYTAAKCRKK